MNEFYSETVEIRKYWGHWRKLAKIHQILCRVGKAYEPIYRNRSYQVPGGTEDKIYYSMGPQPMVPTSNCKYLQLGHWWRRRLLQVTRIIKSTTVTRWMMLLPRAQGCGGAIVAIDAQLGFPVGHCC